MKQVTIYTDGACSGNPGPGGWGAILIYGAHRRQQSGGQHLVVGGLSGLSCPAVRRKPPTTAWSSPP